MSQHEFTLELEGFRGPLGLLLDLIEQRKLHVNDISLAKVADDYIRYIEDRERVPLSQTAQFVVVASTLLLIKSRSLLPSIELTTEEEEDIRDLEKRLQLYAQARNAARVLKQHWGKRAFTSDYTPPQDIRFSPSNDLALSNIIARAQHLIEALPNFTKAPTARIVREIKLDDVIESLTQRMQRAFKGSFKQITSGTERVETIVNFLALLELVKRGTLRAEQTGNFDDIDMEHDAVESLPHYG